MKKIIVNPEQFAAGWKRIQKRAAKLGLPIPNAEPIGPVVDRPRKRTIKMNLESHDYVEVVATQEWEIDIAPLSVSGWTFIGVAEPVGDENALVSIGEFRIPERHAHTGSTCEHCNTSRRRSKTYILASGEETKQVGKSCLGFFLPMSTERIADQAEFMDHIWSFIRESDPDEFWNDSCSAGKGGRAAPCRDVLAIGLALARKYGYVSASKGDELGISSTKDSTQTYMTDRDGRYDFAICPDDFLGKADEIIAWAMGVENDSSFWDAVGAFLRAGYVRLERVGYIVGLVGAWHRHEADEARKRDSAVSQHVGKVGERVSFSGEVVVHSTFEGSYGLGHITIVRTDDGNRIKYWNYIADKGERVEFSAGIKAHETDRDGANITVISRATKIKVLAKS